MTNASRWETVQDLFHRFVDTPAAEREASLRAACDRADIVAEVLELLEEDARGGALIDGCLERAAEAVFADDDEPASPMGFGPYRVLRRLGAGGMGVVYLAERADVGSRAAIKVLRDAWVSPARRERFAAEERTLAQLHHPAIAQLLDANWLPDGTPWFAMEYVDGVTLTEYCRAHGLSIEARIRLFREVCEAVQYAHAQAIIHRDLKPSNILVDVAGRVKLLDFGIAKHLESVEADADHTRTGLRLMTPAYAAPEQWSGGRVGIHTDVYSLGVILYELLCGQPLFDTRAPTPAEALAQRATPRPVRPSLVARAAAEAGGDSSAFRSGAWSDLDVLCATAANFDPARRYPTVEALIRDLDRFLNDEPLWARPDTVGYRLKKFVRRRRVAVTVGASTLVVLLSLVAFYTVRLADARNHALAQAASTVRTQRFLLRLFEGGDDAAGPSEDLRVLTLIERGVEEARLLDEDPAEQAELFRNLGTIFQKLGRFERADGLLTRALERQRVLFGTDDPETATSLVALGLLRLEQARYEEAEQDIRAGITTLRRRRGKGHPSTVEALSALGQVFEARGDYAQAVSVNEDVVELLADRDAAGAEYAAALGQLADSHFYAGNLDVADALNLDLVERLTRIHGPGHPSVADVLVNLGATMTERGRYEEAEARYRSALAILSAFHGPEHFRTAACKTMLGRALVYQGELEEGERLLRSALAIQERVHGPVHPSVASALNDLGSLSLQQGRLDAAEAAFLRMLEIYREIYGDREHYLIGTATSNLASVVVAREDYARAERLYRDAIGVFERTLSPTNLNTGIGRIKLGRALLRQGRHAEAERESLAGHDILAAQAVPAVSWLRSARSDLVAEYEALGRPQDADRFREPAAE